MSPYAGITYDSYMAMTEDLGAWLATYWPDGDPEPNAVMLFVVRWLTDRNLLVEQTEHEPPEHVCDEFCQVCSEPGAR